MAAERPCCAPDPAGIVKKLTLPDGFQVGIAGLDAILTAVADLELVDAEAIKAELLARVAVRNYVASGAEIEYAQALFREYTRRFKAAADGTAVR
jgi:hypothetical protein